MKITTEIFFFFPSLLNTFILIENEMHNSN